MIENRWYLLTIISVFILSGCGKLGLCTEDELQFPRTAYTGNNLRIDGYFFDEPSPISQLVGIYYFYNNGVFFNGGVEVLEDAEASNFVVNVNNEFSKKVKASWGAYRINGSTIEISRWQSEMNGCESTVYSKGEILNDTTFIIRLKEFIEDGDVVHSEAPNEVFHFRPLPQKPDSVNSFI